MPRHKEFEVDAVVNKAMHSFWYNGYTNTSVRMLEKDMGINQFSIYATFGNKHKLFIEVLRKYKSHVKSSFLKNLLESEGDLEDIRSFMLDFGHAVRSGKNANGCLMVNTGMEISNTDKEISKELELYFGFIKQTFYNVLEKAKSKGQLNGDFGSEKHASYLLGSLQGLTLFAKFNSKEEVDNFIDLIMNTLK